MADPVYEIASKPTIYKGIIFRSRLEARWAAFFDQLGWHWNYEPFDLNGWTPDFILGSERLLVEVKPFKFQQLADTCARLIRAAPKANILLLSDHYSVAESYPCAIGRVTELADFDPPAEVRWDHAILSAKGPDIGVVRQEGSWGDLVNDNDMVGRPYGYKSDALIDEKWAAACNATRFEVNQ